YNRKEYPSFLLSRGRVDEAIEAAKVLVQSRWDIVRAGGHIITAHAYLNQNKLPEASKEAKAALTELQSAGNKASIASTDMTVLQGEFFLRTGQKDKGQAVLKQSISKLRAERGPD